MLRRRPPMPVAAAAAPLPAVLTFLFAGSSARAIDWQFGPLISDLVARRHSIAIALPKAGDPAQLALATRGVEVLIPPPAQGVLRLAPSIANRRALAEEFSGRKPHVLVATATPFGLEVFQHPSAADVPHRLLAASAQDFIGIEGDTDGSRQEPGVVEATWRLAIAHATGLIVPTQEDRRRLTAAKNWPANLPITVAATAGLELDSMAELPVPPLSRDGTMTVLLVAPPDAAGSIRLAAEIASAVSAVRPGTRFISTAEPQTPQRVQIAVADTVEDRTTALAAAHVVVAPMAHGTLPPLALQAMAMGRPLIASTNPLTRALIDEPVNGRLVSVIRRLDAAEAWAEAIISVIDTPALLGPMSRASRAKAQRTLGRAEALAALQGALPLEARPRATAETTQHATTGPRSRLRRSA